MANPGTDVTLCRQTAARLHFAPTCAALFMRSHLDQHTLALFNDSIQRCRQSGDLAGQFYDRFVSNPTVRPYFANTKFEHQKRMLTASLYLVVGAAAGTDEGKRHLEQLAGIHARLGIPADLYDLWLAALLATVAALDPQCSAEVSQAWQDVLRHGIEVMRRQAPSGEPSATTRHDTPSSTQATGTGGVDDPGAQRERLLAKIEERLDELPMLPAVVTRLAQLDPDSPTFPEAVEELARLDPPLTARLLHLTQTGMRVPETAMPSIGTAINYIGARRLAETVTSLSVMRVFVPTTRGQRNLWFHAIQTAVAARRIAEMAPADSVAPEQAYLAGLMHDLGRFIMYDRSPRELGQVDETHWCSPAELVAAEIGICGFDHAALGGLACERWGMPDPVTEMVRVHHTYDRDAIAAQPSGLPRLVQVLQTADFTSILLLTRPACGTASKDELARSYRDWFTKVGWRELPCEPGLLAEQLGWVAVETIRLAAILGVSTVPVPEQP